MSPETDSSRSTPARLARAGVKRAVRGYGMATGALRVKPDFIVIGGKRCGTTSLFRNLSRHPSIVPLFPAAQQIKGAHFFDTNYGRGMVWYRSHFASRSRMRLLAKRSGGPMITGEASPYYLFHPLAAGRAAEHVPETKLIVLLRDPVERAYSHFRERVRHDVESLSFEDAIEKEDERLAGEEERMLRDGSYVSFAHEHLSYVSQGKYAEPLRRWTEAFPRSSFLFLVSEDLFEDPEGAYGRVTDFLGLDPLPLESFEKHNYHPGSPMADETRSLLKERFRESNAALADLLGIDFGGWS